MKNPCDECRKNKYCSKMCKKAKNYQTSFVISNVFERLYDKKRKGR